jgi:uroporphyrinogen decarboxylase
MGIDWNHSIASVLTEWSGRFAIQGNVDPEWLFLPEEELTKRLKQVFQSVLSLPREKRQGWICGLGHGVLPKTPETNVRLFLKLQRDMFGDGA